MVSRDAVTANGGRSPLIDLGPRSDKATAFVHGNAQIVGAGVTA